MLAQPAKWAVRFYQGYLVLNYCWAWCDLTTGTVGSKHRGAEWAHYRLTLEFLAWLLEHWETEYGDLRAED